MNINVIPLDNGTTTVSNNSNIVFDNSLTSTTVTLSTDYNIVENASWISISKSKIQQRIEEFKKNKINKKHIDTYLDFMLLEKFITNLEYLEYKDSLKDL